jgi:hypothetical protein
MVDGYVPLRNWYNFVPLGKEKTLMIVPVSEAVASRVPSLFRAMQDSGARCASTTFRASSFSASKIKTSPVVGGTKVEGGGACDGRLSAVSSRGFGNG